MLSRLHAQIALRVAERAIDRTRAEWIRRETLPSRPDHQIRTYCPVCEGDLLACRCDRVRAWLIRTSARVGRGPNREVT